MSQAQQPKKSDMDKYFDVDPITIGEVLETTAMSIGDRPIELSDAEAIQAAERRAFGCDQMQGGGLGDKARSAANFNASAAENDDKITIYDVLLDAASMLPKDKAVTCEDADEVKGAEMRSQAVTRPGGVADTMGKAARVNLQD